MTLKLWVTVLNPSSAMTLIVETPAAAATGVTVTYDYLEPPKLTPEINPGLEKPLLSVKRITFRIVNSKGIAAVGVLTAPI